MGVVSLPRHHELHQLLPQRLGPSKGHRASEGPGRGNIHRWLEGHHGQADLEQQRSRVRHDVLVIMDSFADSGALAPILLICERGWTAPRRRIAKAALRLYSSSS